MGIKFESVSFTYQAQTPFAYQALTNINLEIPTNSYTALIGHTGSGKSTILQLLDGLLIPTEGNVIVNDFTITPQTKQKALAQVRAQVGMVFQFPENQLFEQTVLADVMFGPLNFGKTKEEATKLAKEALQLVELPAEYWEQSPFELSGGQMRRVAIAGVLALDPKILVLDEPTAGLDPKGRLEIMAMFNRLYQEKKLTVILVTHQMDDVLKYASNVIVMDSGKVVKTTKPLTLFTDQEWLISHQLDTPKIIEFAQKIMHKGIMLDHLPNSTRELATMLIKKLKIEVKRPNDE